MTAALLLVIGMAASVAASAVALRRISPNGERDGLAWAAAVLAFFAVTVAWLWLMRQDPDLARQVDAILAE